MCGAQRRGHPFGGSVLSASPEARWKPTWVCGVDEAGRGPLAGGVYAAAVILDPDRPIQGLRDSKMLSEGRRERLAIEIRERALAWACASASVDEIDQLNILQATLRPCSAQSCS